MAAGWVAAGDGVQLRLRAQLLQPDDGAPGVVVGRRLPAPRRRRRLVRQLAPRRTPSRRRPQVHPLQGPHGLRLRDKHDRKMQADSSCCCEGTNMYYITWFLQFTTLLLGSMGFILLGGRALKAISAEFTGDSTPRLQWFIAATGAVYFAFAYFVPTISAMRNWLATSAALTVTFDVALLAVLVKDGRSSKQTDYTIHGTQQEKVFNALGAVAAILVCNTSGLLPEIQSTLRKPSVSNMRRALALQYTVGAAAYYGISVAGYWAYGAAASEYLPNQLGGPRWASVLINATAFLQSIVSQHLFTVPIHEAMDTRLQRLDEGMFSRHNMARRLVARAVLFGVNVFVTALFPFMGDFVNLFGSFALFPLTFIFPSMIVLKIKGECDGRWHMLWHWGIIVVSSVLGVATTAAAVRLIVHNVSVYRFFADI
ncbi:proline transporter 1 isoform X2 [Lolium perenne]|uniref:proline transporter 1 isoform X2 n=1 Tax=Lolium perenne TaxID=4522 RepID=UPI0021F5AB41|nr:proline transporter 1-like isoform X2 [Lolium perenne]